ncbi:hypothetical protein VTK73DRAFT_3816 [Phialemonium thermophilum]|uniref:Alpha/beta hydrolase fold-3 domain-containing protein n=1 Tax=Phialemonium thermophilum TaxID=223376 RepID=A0ABR3VED9_9PEZI
MAPLTKTTRVYATHNIPLECDVYEADDYPADAPVLLWFHAGGLVDGSRVAIPPWLVQACFQRKWPLVSASYRLLPQTGADGLLEDAAAAYRFARTLGGATERRVIAAGSSAGFFMASLIAQHLQPKPLALLSDTGIPTFDHPFFRSSHQIEDPLLSRDDADGYCAEPLSVGQTPLSLFRLDMLLPSGARNPDVTPAKPVALRHRLYAYFVRTNAYGDLVGKVDRGFGWARRDPAGRRDDELADWPVTVFIQGDDDHDTPVEVCASVAEALGERARFCLARGQDHCFEVNCFLEDGDRPGMEAVREALGELDQAVAAAAAAAAAMSQA